MLPRPPRSTRPDTLFPYTTLFLSVTVDVTEADRAAVAVVVEIAGNLVRRRWRQRHAGQRIQSGNVVATKIELEPGTGKRDGILQCAVQRDLGIAILQFQLDRLGLDRKSVE